MARNKNKLSGPAEHDRRPLTTRAAAGVLALSMFMGGCSSSETPQDSAPQSVEVQTKEGFHELTPDQRERVDIATRQAALGIFKDLYYSPRAERSKPGTDVYAGMTGRLQAAASDKYGHQLDMAFIGAWSTPDGVKIGVEYSTDRVPQDKQEIGDMLWGGCYEFMNSSDEVVTMLSDGKLSIEEAKKLLESNDTKLLSATKYTTDKAVGDDVNKEFTITMSDGGYTVGSREYTDWEGEMQPVTDAEEASSRLNQVMNFKPQRQ